MNPIKELIQAICWNSVQKNLCTYTEVTLLRTRISAAIYVRTPRRDGKWHHIVHDKRPEHPEDYCSAKNVFKM